MKSIKITILTSGLVGILITMAAFVNRHYEKVMKDLQTTHSSKGFAVVELFTSEGCSSCPPADELVERIQTDNKNKQIYILAFHVDYWNRLGWKDKFSDPEYSKRQKQYAGWLNVHNIYTPQIIVNGLYEYVGSDTGNILNTLAGELNQESEGALTIKGKVENGKLEVSYTATQTKKNTELVLALVQKNAQSNVNAGENSGKTLSHVQIVRRLFHVNPDTRNGISIDLPHDFNEKDWELIGFMQEKENGRISAANRYQP